MDVDQTASSILHLMITKGELQLPTFVPHRVHAVEPTEPAEVRRRRRRMSCERRGPHGWWWQLTFYHSLVPTDLTFDHSLGMTWGSA